MRRLFETMLLQSPLSPPPEDREGAEALDADLADESEVIRALTALAPRLSAVFNTSLDPHDDAQGRHTALGELLERLAPPGETRGTHVQAARPPPPTPPLGGGTSTVPAALWRPLFHRPDLVQWDMRAPPRAP